MDDDQKIKKKQEVFVYLSWNKYLITRLMKSNVYSTAKKILSILSINEKSKENLDVILNEILHLKDVIRVQLAEIS